MGGCTSCAQTDSYSPVDRQLAEAEHAERNHYKVLLLGPGEAGKSTVLKQLKCVYKGGLSARDQQVHARAVQRNTITCMQAILEAMPELGFEVADEAAARAAARVMDLDETALLSDDPEIVDDIERLWADQGVRDAYAERDKYWLLDAAPYYFANVYRFSQSNYVPTDEDTIMARVRTSGMSITEFDDGRHRFSVVDVGGQRSERRKWITMFEDIKAIIFVVSLAGYNQVLYEDSGANRLHESLKLFEDVVSNPIFRDTPIFLFLNKKDVFEQMIQEQASLNACFPEYVGDEQDVLAAVEEIAGRFSAIMKRHCPRKHLQTHVVAARVRMDIKVSFSEVKDGIKAHYARAAARENGLPFPSKSI